MGDETTTAEDPRSRLEIALHTAVEELTDEQKALIVESVGALSEEEVARFTEAGVLTATAPSVAEAAPAETVSEGTAETTEPAAE